MKWRVISDKWQEDVDKRALLPTCHLPLATAGEAGFTLVEMIVSIALFSVVMLVAVGALLSLTAANKKAQALQSVMNNLNISLDSMVRNVRMGIGYRCAVGDFSKDDIRDCTTGGSVVTFTCNDETPACAKSTSKRWGYTLGCGTTANAICKSVNAGGTPTWAPITAPEVTIQNMTFYVVGTSRSDSIEPKVIMVVKGQAGAGKSQTTFHIQATAVQRELDL